MPQSSSQWQLPSTIAPPDWFVQAVRQVVPDAKGGYLAQVLWQRNLIQVETLAGFLQPDQYQPTSPFAFGAEMTWAVERLQRARQADDRIAIWGDFDADGITATAVLWEGFSQFFTPQTQLTYYIPNRLTESHGLSRSGLDQLAAWGCQLIVTCDTGSTNLDEIDYARHLDMDVIVTDHHTLPAQRPPVTAILNPRYFTPDHPLYHLSGVAVAYKLVEALYLTLPDVPQQPLDNLLELVAIGLIADLVQLTGDCRYLAQQGLARLQKLNQARQRRPGVVRLLELCQRAGDRPTDISFGLGPRINAVSRIQGDAHFCVELLTSTDPVHGCHLAEQAETLNARRKALQRDILQQVTDQLTQLDLSTTSVIVLAEVGWPVGILGIVAGQIAQEYGRPTILLSIEQRVDESVDRRISRSAENGHQSGDIPSPPHPLARGSARSYGNIDLYQVVKQQAHLLHKFGGHPLAAGLSLPVANIPIFTEAINRELRQQPEWQAALLNGAAVRADLVVTVAELGQDLFRELKWLEPCGIGNPVPRLLIQNCWFDNLWNKNIRDWRNNKLRYIRTGFELWDESISSTTAIAPSGGGFPGFWWGHYQDEIPVGRCDAIVELDFDTLKKGYHVRLIAVRPTTSQLNHLTPSDWILDRRPTDAIQALTPPSVPSPDLSALSTLPSLPATLPDTLPITRCPTSWDELQRWLRRAMQEEQRVAIAYPPPVSPSPSQIWQQLVGIAKYLHRTGETASYPQLQTRLDLSPPTIALGLQALAAFGFEVVIQPDGQVQIPAYHLPATIDAIHLSHTLHQLLTALQEEQFRRHYFAQVPLSTIAATCLG